MNKLFKISYYVFFAALIVIGGLLVATLFPVPGNFQVNVVQSDRMEPTIHAGSVVITKSSDSYQVGDIVTFGKENGADTSTTHRIVGVEVVDEAFLYTTKGDANEDPDVNKVPESAIVGKVLITLSYVGYVIDFAKKPLGLALLVGIPVLFLALEEVGRLMRKRERMKAKRKKEDIAEKTRQAKQKQYERLTRKTMQVETTHRFAKAPGPDDPEDAEESEESTTNNRDSLKE